MESRNFIWMKKSFSPSSAIFLLEEMGVYRKYGIREKAGKEGG